MPLDHWLDSIDKSRTTGWKWRQQGFVKTVNICGRQYISLEEIERFQQRAAAGEFQREPQIGKIRQAQRAAAMA